MSDVARSGQRAAVSAAALLLLVAAGWAQSPAAEIEALVARGDLPAAARRACEWAEAEPGDLEALRNCGELGQRAGLNRAAARALESLLFFTPNDPDVLLLLGKALLARGNFAEARRQFERVVHLQADAAPAYVGLAQASVGAGDTSGDILSAAEIALSVGPDHAPAHVAMGVALRTVGEYAQALAALERALALDPQCASALYELGLTRAQTGDEDGAREAWRRFLAVEPHSDRAWLLGRDLVVVGIEDIIDRGFGPQYSPDGTRIAFRGRGQGGWGVYVMPADASAEETLLWSTEDSLSTLAWAPDGKSLLVLVSLQKPVTTRGQETKQWTRQLLLVPADGSAPPRLLLEDQRIGEAAWIPSTGHIGVRTFVTRQGWAVLDLDPETGEGTPIPGIDPRAALQSPAWSRDGTMMLMVRRTEARPDGSYGYELLVGPTTDFSQARVVFFADDAPRDPVFVQDGSVILFGLAGAGNRVSTWALPSDGSRDPVLVDNDGGPYGTPSLSPDGRYMVQMSASNSMMRRLTLAGLRDAPGD